MKRSFTTSSNFSFLFSQVPHDCFCCIIQFFESKDDFLNLCLVVKNLFNYVSKILPSTTEHVSFEWRYRYRPKQPKKYVFNVKIYKKVEDEKKNKYDITKIEKFFPNLENFILDWEDIWYDLERENSFPAMFYNTNGNLKVLEVFYMNTVLISDFPNLEIIVIKNRDEDVIASSKCFLILEKTPKLCSLEIHDFSIKKTIPQSLRSLIIKGTLIEEIKELPNLESLSINHQNIVGEISFLDNLKTLIFGSPDCSCCWGCENNEGTSIHVTRLKNLKSLEILRISSMDTNLDVIPVFNLRIIDVLSLKKLYFDGILCEEEEKLSIKNLNNIEIISVKMCLIVIEFRGVFRYLSNLSVKNNSYLITDYQGSSKLVSKFKPKSFFYSENLTVLKLSYINFHPILPDENSFLNKFKKLKELTFLKNMIETYDFDENELEKRRNYDLVVQNLENLEILEFDSVLVKISNCPKLKVLNIYLSNSYNYKETDSIEISERLSNIKSLREICINLFYDDFFYEEGENDSINENFSLVFNEISDLKKIMIREKMAGVTLKKCFNLEFIDVHAEKFEISGSPIVEHVDITSKEIVVEENFRKIEFLKYFHGDGLDYYAESNEIHPYLVLPFSTPHLFIKSINIITYCELSIFSEEKFPNLKTLKLMISKDNDRIEIFECSRLEEIDIDCFNKKNISIFCDSLPLLKELTITVNNEGEIKEIKLSNFTQEFNQFNLKKNVASNLFGMVKSLKIEKCDNSMKKAKFSGICFCDNISLSKLMFLELYLFEVINLDLNIILCKGLSIEGTLNYSRDISNLSNTKYLRVVQRIEEMITNYSNLPEITKISVGIPLDSGNKIIKYEGMNKMEKNLNLYFNNLPKFETFYFNPDILKKGIVKKITLNFRNCENFSEINPEKGKYCSNEKKRRFLCQAKDLSGNCIILKSNTKVIGGFYVHSYLRKNINFLGCFIIEILFPATY